MLDHVEYKDPPLDLYSNKNQQLDLARSSVSKLKTLYDKRRNTSHQDVPNGSYQGVKISFRVDALPI